MKLLDHTTDKILMVVVLVAFLIAAIYTMDPSMIEAVKMAGATVLGAFAARITNTTETN